MRSVDPEPLFNDWSFVMKWRVEHGAQSKEGVWMSNSDDNGSLSCEETNESAGNEALKYGKGKWLVVRELALK